MPSVSIAGRGVRLNFGGDGKLLLVSNGYGADCNAEECAVWLYCIVELGYLMDGEKMVSRGW